MVKVSRICRICEYRNILPHKNFPLYGILHTLQYGKFSLTHHHSFGKILADYPNQFAVFCNSSCTKLIVDKRV